MTLPFDASACIRADLDDLSEDKLRWFLRTARQERQYALAQNTPMPEVLEHLNLLDGAAPTHAAMLLFGRYPQRFLMSSEVKCMHYHGTEVRKPIPSYQTYKGTVFDLVDQAVDFVMSKVDRAVGTRANGPQAPVTYELPRDAVAEAIVNAVAHRDYTSNASVQVMLFADRLEVWSPGELPPTLTPELLRRPHASIPRNPLIAEPLFLAHYIEKAGTGTLDIISLCKDAGLPEPDFRQDGGQWVVTLWRPKPTPGTKSAPTRRQVAGEVTGQVTGEVRQLLHALEKSPLSRAKAQAALGLKGLANFRDRYLGPALEAGLVEMTIPEKPRSRKQKYRLTAEGKEVLSSDAGGEQEGPDSE